MALKLELNMKLTQQLVMTPQLQMAIKLLQLTRMELAEMVTQELQENPTLEELDYGSPDEGFLTNSDYMANDDHSGNKEDNGDVTTPLEVNDVDAKMASDLDNQVADMNKAESEIDWDKYFDKYMDGPSDILPRDTGSEDKAGFEEYYAKESNLYDYLMWQLRFTDISEDEIKIGEEIIGNINDDGYLTDVSLEDIAYVCGVDLADVEKVHKRIMRFEPVGIAARNLRECLLNQSKFTENGTPLSSRIIQDHWDLVEKRNIVKLARVLKVSKDEVQEAMRVIISLDPKPGAQYSEERIEYVVPDIYVRKVGDEYHIQLNEDGMPRLKVNSYYQKNILAKAGSQETREFIKNKLRSATWLIKSIQQRQRTIYKVTESIVKQQKDFLDKGVEYLKPMVLRNVAEDIEMHECTVSRVTTNKYVHTPQGVFELKYFFNSGITNSSGEDVSSESIKTRIKQLIEKENPKKPLSDQKLVALLKEEGTKVARRTVAKYREALGILSSSGRRKTF